MERARRGRGPGRTAWIGFAAILVLALIVAISVLRASLELPASVASASPSVPSVTTIPPAPSNPTLSPSASAPAVRPDARHGLIVATGNLRTEDDPRGLQEPSLFMTAPTSSYTASPDGKRIALIRTSQTGQEIVTFSTARPNDVTTVLDLAGTGEFVTNIVWAGDGADYLVYSADRSAGSAIAYSVVRSIDLAAKKQSEIARITSGRHLVPLSWRFDTHVGGAVEQEAPSARVSTYYAIRDNGLVSATALAAAFLPQIGASRDGRRIVLSSSTSVRWWPVDQPAAAKELVAASGDTLGHVEFRPGTDEIGVNAGGRFEIWTLDGQRRVAATRVGDFDHWRVDGTAAITSPGPNTVLLVDPATGATTPLPGGGFPVADVVLF